MSQPVAVEKTTFQLAKIGFCCRPWKITALCLPSINKDFERWCMTKTFGVPVLEAM